MNGYRMLTAAAAPLLPLWLNWRKARGKEDPRRLRERFGHASLARPKGELLWLHAASVGEANSVLLLISRIQERFPDLNLLLTTGTVTSAALMSKRLPKTVLHQYVPVDTPEAVERFMRHWHPDIALWVESEFWPNLVAAADKYEAFMGVINARMSQRSFRKWRKRPAMIRSMLQCFNLILAQSGPDAGRLEALGAKDVLCVGNLKYDAALLACDEAELIRLQSAIAGRPLWLASSTHPGEEAMAAQAHALLSATRPDLLTIIVPRHADRGPALADELGKRWRVALRSRRQPIEAGTQLYIADTMGELGLFYRLCETVFMGGSLVKHGGQNPLEPARLSCAILTGPHTHNFAEIYAEMEGLGLCQRVTSAENLAARIDRLLNDGAARNSMQSAALQWINGKSGTAQRVLELLEPIIDPGSMRS